MPDAEIDVPHLREIAADSRYSDEFVGSVLRRKLPSLLVQVWTEGYQACFEGELGDRSPYIEEPGDPYDRPVFIQGHMHSEPVCAWPDCDTYLTREQMRRAHEEKRDG